MLQRNWDQPDRRKADIIDGCRKLAGVLGFQAGWWRTISIYIDNTLYVILAGAYLANAFDLELEAEMVFKLR